MTDDEVIEELQSRSALNIARQLFSSWAARIHNAHLQRHPISPIEWRRMEFQAVKEIAAALGIEELQAFWDEHHPVIH